MQQLDNLKAALVAAEQQKQHCHLAWIADAENTEKRQQSTDAYERVLTLQRDIAALENSEYCLPIALGFRWDTGAALPHLIQNEYKTSLLFFLQEERSGWTGESVEVVSLSETESLIGLIEFDVCRSTRFGAPNDETLEGHPLYGKGLDYYAPFQVKNSNWIKELDRINQAHFNWRAGSMDRFNHYLFTFHDSIFECVAKSYKTAVLQGTMAEAYMQQSKQLFD